MTPLTFVLAQNHYLQLKKVTRMTILALAFALLPYLLLTPRYFHSTSLTCSGLWFGLCLLAYVAAHYWDHPNVEKQLANSRLVISDTILEQRIKTLVQKIPFAEITHVVLVEKLAGQIEMIRVKTVTDYATLRGFEGMNQIAAEIAARVPASAIVQRKPLWFDMYASPSPFLTIVILFFFIVMSFQGGSDDLNWLVVWTYLVIGTYSLFWRPQFKREGKSKRSADTNTAFVAFIATFFFFLNQADELPAYWQDPCAFVGRVARRSGCVEVVPAEGSIQFAADSRTILWSERQFILMPPYNAWVGFWTPHLSYDWVKLFTVSADQQSVAVIGCDGGDELVVDVWDIPTRTQRARLPMTVNEFADEEAFALSPDGQLLALADPLVGITLWQVTTGQPGVTLERNEPLVEPSLTSIAFSVDGRFVAGQTRLNEVTIWQVADGAIWQEIVLPEGVDPLMDYLRFSPDGRWLLTTNHTYNQQGTDVADLLIWDLATGDLSYRWTLDHAEYRYDVAFSPTGSYLFGAFVISEPRNGVHYANEAESTLFVWDMVTGTAYGQMLLGLGSERTPESVSVSLDGLWLAVGTRDEGLVFEVEKLLTAVTLPE